MSSKKGRRAEIATVAGAEVDLDDDLVGRRVIVMRADDDGYEEEFEGLVDGRMEGTRYLIDFKQSKYLKKKSKDAELNAMEVVDLGIKDTWRLIQLKSGEEKEKTYGSLLDNPMPKGGCPAGREIIEAGIDGMVWQRINVMWDGGNVFSGYVVRVLNPPKVKVVYDDEDTENIDLTETCWRLITKEYEQLDQKTLTKFKKTLSRKEYGETSKETPTRRSQQTTPEQQHPQTSNRSQEAHETTPTVAETDPAQKKRGKRKATSAATPPEEKEVKKYKEDDEVKQQKQTAAQNRSPYQSPASAHGNRRGGGTNAQNGRGESTRATGGGTDNHRTGGGGTEGGRASNPEPAYEMLVDDREIKVIKFMGQQEHATMYDMVLVLPGISKENVAVECGDFTVRVSVDLRDENNIQNRNNDADGEVKKQGVNGVQLDGNQESQQIKKYCIVLPEHIVPEATTAEVSPIGRLRIKCVAGDSEISDNNC
eukprot:TRINITY_DN5504_c0_g1_i3.p1 TRINITY_DN5504_c0_g1~~TRINITY_DN5504_c0_g1_i3.p1  ORF type:complete len:528 (+),score=127.01 TRINITY_DN5504_c0_g1_i3:145-1584(+)